MKGIMKEIYQNQYQETNIKDPGQWRKQSHAWEKNKARFTQQN